MTKIFSVSLLAACLMSTGLVSTAFGLPEDPYNHPTCSGERADYMFLDEACNESTQAADEAWWDWWACGFCSELEEQYNSAAEVRFLICVQKESSYAEFLQCLEDNANY